MCVYHTFYSGNTHDRAVNVTHYGSAERNMLTISYRIKIQDKDKDKAQLKMSSF